MKQDAKGKLFVGMMVSIVAFGFATGAGVFMNTNPLSSAGIMNLTHQSEFPSITTEPYNTSGSQNNNNKQNTSISNPNNVVTKTPTNTPTSNNNNNGNNKKTPPKSNNTSTNSSG